MFLRSAAREFESEADDPVDAAAGEDAFLDHGFLLGAFEDPTADARIFAFGVFAYHQEVDVANLASAQRRRNTRHQAHRPQVNVLIELASQLEQRAP